MIVQDIRQPVRQDRKLSPTGAEVHGGEARLFSRRLRSYIHSQSLEFPVVSLPKKTALYTAGEDGNSLFMIDNGRVKAEQNSPCGKGCLLDIYAQGEVLGESCLHGPRRTETATAMVHAVLRKIPRDQFLALLVEGGLLEDWLRYLTARLTGQQKLITLLVTVDSEQRLAVILLRLARRLGTPDRGLIRIDQRITHQELSEMVGTTRSRVGYFLNRFRRMGLVEESPMLVINELRLSRYVEAWT